MSNETEKPVPEAEVAWYIRAFWDSIGAAAWPKDDLINLGKLVYAKTPIQDVPDKIFYHLLPQLRAVASRFAILVRDRKTAEPPAPSPATPPGEAA